MTLRLPIYQVAAFAPRLFGGNPAAVVPLSAWLPDATLQAIAAENNLSETAFLVADADAYELRWFTPAVEVDLCGHATLASGHVVLQHLKPGTARVVFHTRKAGALTVERRGDLLELELPAREAAPCDAPPGLAAALGAAPRAVLAARDLLAVFDDADTVRALRPSFGALMALAAFGVIVTAPGTGADEDVDFVSRFFAPRQGIDEDPVTGSAHCTLVPFWAAKLGRAALRARQVSPRVGELDCTLHEGGRVALRGRTIPYLEGVIFV